MGRSSAQTGELNRHEQMSWKPTQFIGRRRPERHRRGNKHARKARTKLNRVQLASSSKSQPASQRTSGQARSTSTSAASAAHTNLPAHRRVSFDAIQVSVELAFILHFTPSTYLPLKINTTGPRKFLLSSSLTQQHRTLAQAPIAASLRVIPP